MERKYGAPARQLLIAALVLLVTVGITACQRQVVTTTPLVVKMPVPGRTLVETSDVFKNGKLFGRMRKFRFDDLKRSYVTRIYNLRNDHMGYVTEDGRAFKLRAHGGHDLVANHRDMRQNVAAVMGVPLERVDIKVVASAQ